MVVMILNSVETGDAVDGDADPIVFKGGDRINFLQNRNPAVFWL